MLPHKGVYVESASSDAHQKALANRQAKRKEWSKVILTAVIIYLALNCSLGFAQLEFRSRQVEILREEFALCIPSLLLTSAILSLGKGCLQRICELLLCIALLVLPLLVFTCFTLNTTTIHHFSRDRQVEASYVDNGAFGSSAHSIKAKQGWGPFFYHIKSEGIDTYPFIGQEIDGEVEVKYDKDGMTVTRDLDEWLAGRPGSKKRKQLK